MLLYNVAPALSSVPQFLLNMYLTVLVYTQHSDGRDDLYGITGYRNQTTKFLYLFIIVFIRDGFEDTTFEAKANDSKKS